MMPSYYVTTEQAPTTCKCGGDLKMSCRIRRKSGSVAVSYECLKCGGLVFWSGTGKTTSLVVPSDAGRT